MKKKLLSMTLAALLCASLGLAGCGSSSDAKSTSAADASSAGAASVSASSASASGTSDTSSAGASSAASSETEDAAADSTSSASAEASSADSADVKTLKVGLLGNSVKPVGVLVADAMGYFEEEGVNVEFEKVSSMNDAYMAVSTGDLDVYLFSSTAAATFISQGTTTLRVFGGTAAEGSEIMAAPDSGITLDSAESLAGKTIACQMPETGQMVLKNYLIEEGYTIGEPGENADVTFVYVEDGNTAVEGVLKGEYDLCITNQCLGYYADELGVELVGAVKDFVDPYPCCRQTCNEKTYEENKDALIKFETAALRGYDFYRNNEEKTLDILVDYAGEDRDFIKGQVYGTDSYTPVMRLSLDPDKDACIKFYEAMGNIGQIDNTLDIDWSKYVVTDVYESALNDLAAREPDNALWGELTEYFKAHNTI
ncbi:MAG: ABC transporter substrate-binding protein [Eubacterium sp.]|nr:ABC transporter substrate-binding protein [Eubacterium sp.]